jgi:DEAD/H associated
VEYFGAGAAVFGCLPTQETVVLERFFDEAGGMQLVIHAPLGSRINRAWGLALRKRICRKFNFELQAAATEDNIVLSLTAAHSFELSQVAKYLHSTGVRSLLTQAPLDAPMFTTRWRWVAGVALALPRFRAGKKVPPQFMRTRFAGLSPGRGHRRRTKWGSGYRRGMQPNSGWALMLKPFVDTLNDHDTAWLVIAMASTLAGNFTVLGSIANLIVVQRAAASGVAISFWDYFRVGAPLTIITLAIGTLWLWR